METVTHFEVMVSPFQSIC